MSVYLHHYLYSRNQTINLNYACSYTPQLYSFLKRYYYDHYYYYREWVSSPAASAVAVPVVHTGALGRTEGLCPDPAAQQNLGHQQTIHPSVRWTSADTHTSTHQIPTRSSVDKNSFISPQGKPIKAWKVPRSMHLVKHANRWEGSREEREVWEVRARMGGRNPD